MNKSLIKRMKEERFSRVSIDLFSGPGGLCTGFKWAGILPLVAVEWTDTTVETYSVTHNAEVFELSEYMKDGKADANYLKKFLKESTRTILVHGDINLVTNEMIKSFLLNRYGIDCSDENCVDVVSGGAPCESFSLAGTRTAGDERDDLFSNIVRISRAVNTKMILFENVKGMFSKAKDGVKGAIFNYICDTFEDENAKPSYRLTSRDQNTILLRACDYGVPQLRERLFLVSTRRDLEDVNFSYPKKEYGPGCKYPYVTVADAFGGLPKVEMAETKNEYIAPKKYSNENQERFLKIVRGELDTEEFHGAAPKHLIENGLYSENGLSSHTAPGHIKRKQELLALIRPEESMKDTYDRLVADGTIDEYRHLFPNTIYASRNRRLVKAEPSFTVTSHCLDEMLHPNINRAISPREAARLQSFPDWYQFAGPFVQFHGDKVQDRYEQIGDAIPPLLAYAIAKEIVKALNGEK